MSSEQWEFLRLAGLAAIVSGCLWVLSCQRDDSRVFRAVSKVMENGALRNPWVGSPRTRIRLFAILAAVLAVVMLVGLFTGPHDQ